MRENAGGYHAWRTMRVSWQIADAHFKHALPSAPCTVNPRRSKYAGILQKGTYARAVALKNKSEKEKARGGEEGEKKRTVGVAFEGRCA